VHSGTARPAGNVYPYRMRCDSCSQLATVRIPDEPGRVCLAHAIEFWTGFLAYARNERRAQKKLERLSERLRTLAQIPPGEVIVADAG
jgi:hypothetical protein